MMRRYIQLTLFIFLCFFFIRTEAQNLATSIKLQAMNMGNAAMKNDFETFIKYMHPSVVAWTGGAAQMKQKMDSAYQAMQKFNVRFKRYWIGQPSKIINYKKQLQAVLPQSTIMATPFGELLAETAMVVISADNGKNWWFIDTSIYNANKLKTILPTLSPELVIPPRKKPKLLPLKDSQ